MKVFDVVFEGLYTYEQYTLIQVESTDTLSAVLNRIEGCQIGYNVLLTGADFPTTVSLLKHLLPIHRVSTPDLEKGVYREFEGDGVVPFSKLWIYVSEEGQYLNIGNGRKQSRLPDQHGSGGLSRVESGKVTVSSPCPFGLR